MLRSIGKQSRESADCDQSMHRLIGRYRRAKQSLELEPFAVSLYTVYFQLRRRTVRAKGGEKWCLWLAHNRDVTMRVINKRLWYNWVTVT